MKINLVSNIGLCFSLAVLWAACGENTNKQEASPTENVQVTHECYQGFNYSYEDILSKDNLDKHLSIDEPSLEVNSNTSQDQYGSVTYQWASDRPDQIMEISGMTFPKADLNYVRLKGLKFYEEDEPSTTNQAVVENIFSQGYKVLSNEEYDTLLANLRATYETGTSEYDQAKDLLDLRMKNNYEALSDLGNQAYWKWSDIHGGELVVLHGNTSFILEAKLSSSPAETLEKAKLLASEIIAKCSIN